jgi:arylformamidase
MSTPGSEQMSLAELGAAVRGLRLHDVSPTVDPDLPRFFATPSFMIHPVAEHATDGAAANVLELHEHIGSHVDAPFHFDPNGLAMDAMPPDVLFFQPFKKFDLTTDDPQPGEPVDVDQLVAAADRGGFALEDGDVAVLEFGWDRYLPGGQDERDPSWWGGNEPGLTAPACEHLAAAGISAVACDTAACDVSLRDAEILGAPGHAGSFLPKGILIVEGLRGLAEVPTAGLFVALPLKIAQATGSPLRVLMLTE